MQTIAKITNRSYTNKIPLEVRIYIVQWYEEGYAIRKIAMALQVRTDTIRHHLKAFGILEVDRKICKWNAPVPLLPRRKKTWNELKSIVDPLLPPHIRAVYLRMHEEDEEIANRVEKKKSSRYVPHKHIMAHDPRKFINMPFIVSRSFDL